MQQLVANSHLRQIIAWNAGNNEDAGGVKSGQGPAEDETVAITTIGLLHDLSGRAGGTCDAGNEGRRHRAVLEDETTIKPDVFFDNMRPCESARSFGSGLAHGALQARRSQDTGNSPRKGPPVTRGEPANRNRRQRSCRTGRLPPTLPPAYHRPSPPAPPCRMIRNATA